MARSTYIGAIVLGAAAGLALLKYYSMTEEERQDFLSHLKNRTMIYLMMRKALWIK